MLRRSCLTLLCAAQVYAAPAVQLPVPHACLEGLEAARVSCRLTCTCHASHALWQVQCFLDNTSLQ